VRQHSEIIDISRWGKDHWSTFLYVESRVVDHGGTVNHVHLRKDGNEYPTRLSGGNALVEHNDYDCLEDMEAARLIEHSAGTGLNPIYTLTNEGWRVAGLVRRWKAEGKGIAKFTLGGDVRCNWCGYADNGDLDTICGRDDCFHATPPDED